ncbi:MAG TPA: hypothetical protein VL087_07910 [Nitrospirota bacterium]|nr:hypothetical protein [Nitrospirota bacterium]
MLNNLFVKNLFVALFISAIHVPIGQSQAYAQISGMHEHQDMQHMHTMGGEDVIADIKTDPERISVGSSTNILFSIKDRGGKPIQELSIHHDRILHVIIASQDFSVFAHIHPEDFGPITPEMKKFARYPVRFTFPKAGRYIIAIDFAVQEQLISKHFLIDVAGAPKMGFPTRDLSREKRFGDLDVTLTSSPERITAGTEVILSYLFRKNGKSVTDLEPYLSAPMHLAIISSDLTHFIHTHGELPGMPSMGHDAHNMQMKMTVPDKFGPEVEIHVVFPAKGRYQIFGQVGHHGKIIVTNFMVEVE